MASQGSVKCTVEPPSPTAICKLDYAIPSPPTIYVVPVEITSGDASTRRHHVKSQRLRAKSIVAIIVKKLPLCKHNYAVQFWAGQGPDGNKYVPIDHLLLLAPANTSHDQLVKLLSGVQAGEVPSDLVKHVKGANGNTASEKLHYSLQTETCVTPAAGRPYWSKLETVISALFLAADLNCQMWDDRTKMRKKVVCSTEQTSKLMYIR